MKTFQWILLLAGLVVVVFGITFFTMYRQSAPKASTTKNSSATNRSGDSAQGGLEFASTRFGAETRANEVAPQTEYGKPGWHDFWFHNPHDKEVRLGLNSKNCVCTEVQIFLCQGDWRTKAAPARLANLAAGSPFEVALTQTLAAQREEEQIPGWIDAGQKLDPNVEGAMATVAAGQTGFLRMKWDGRRSGGDPFKTQTLTAALWYSSKASGAGADLQVVGAWLVEPVLFEPRELEAGSMSPDDAPRRLLTRCWSFTRRDLRLVCDTGNDPLISWEIKPFTSSDENRVLSIAQQMPSIRSGVRLEMRIRPRSSDGSKMLDLGPFRRRVTVKIFDDKEELGSEQLLIHGEIKGDVRVIVPGNQESGLLMFGTFKVRDGKTMLATVEAERSNIEVTVEKVPPFIEAKLEKLPGTDKPSWRLHVKVLPNKVSGVLPRDESEVFLSIKSTGEPARRVRIPVIGEATQ